MKKLIYTILSLFLFININCKKENLIVKSLAGNWELRQVGGGVSSKITTYQEGNGSLLKFTNNTYQIFTNHALVKSGTYKILKGKSILSNEEVDRIIYDNDLNGATTVISIENNRLYLSTDVYDSQLSTYEKIQ